MLVRGLFSGSIPRRAPLEATLTQLRQLNGQDPRWPALLDDLLGKQIPLARYNWPAFVASGQEIWQLEKTCLSGPTPVAPGFSRFWEGYLQLWGDHFDGASQDCLQGLVLLDYLKKVHPTIRLLESLSYRLLSILVADSQVENLGAGKLINLLILGIQLQQTAKGLMEPLLKHVQVYLTAGEVEPQDLPKLLAIYDHLGIIHYRAFRQVADLLTEGDHTDPTLVGAFKVLARCNVFPQTFVHFLASHLQASRLATVDALSLLRSCAKLRVRLPQILSFLKGAPNWSHLEFHQIGQLAFDCARLDYWVPSVFHQLEESLTQRPDFTLKLSANIWFALCYFGYGSLEAHHWLIHLLMAGEPQLASLTQNAPLSLLKICELSVRTGHASIGYDQLGQGDQDFLARLRIAKFPILESTESSSFQEEVADYLATHRLTRVMTREIQVGPYVCDFIRFRDENHFRPVPHTLNREVNEEVNVNIFNAIALEVQGPSHFYRNSKDWTAFAKFKDRLLALLGVRILNLNYFDWFPLDRAGKTRMIKSLLEAEFQPEK